MIDNQTPPFEVINAKGSASLLIACDHAHNLIPDSLSGLGVNPDYLRRHIAYDIGAKQVAMKLAELLDAPLLLAKYSRLVIDLNRHLHDPSLIAECSDGVEIPGNLNLTAEMRADRINRYFHPYHNQYQDMVSNLISKHNRPIILAVHSFTPIMNGVARPWEMGVLWEQDEVLAKQLIVNLSKVTGFNIGDNKPYHATDPQGYAQARYSHEHGVELVLLEIRQDLITDCDGQTKITESVCQALSAILN